jgi:hypothetical protein
MAAATVIVTEAGGVAIDRTRHPLPVVRHSRSARPAHQLMKGIIAVSQKYWHVPLPTRPTCPVCKKAVYSRAGIHPQCAVSQAESVRPVKPDPPHSNDPVHSK